MIDAVAVDGPAGAGKSSASRALAGRFGFVHIDTGAMYRAVGVLADGRGVALDDAAALGRLVADLVLEFTAGGRLVANGADVTDAIRRPLAGELASRVSTEPGVRRRLVAIQRELAGGGRVVMEGRDIGTVVLPDARAKFYLIADPRTRAARRAAELRAAGESVDENALTVEIAARDQRDAGRVHSPLRPADDALVIDTTALGLDDVVALMERVARERGVATGEPPGSP
ncbi:MAG TPA: (d)CMP kinase [Candidatus Binatia bacterium]|nr:(d)CMP kinase [Candidatus Binatia bacterium]